jgi:hypothetical protein
MKREDDAYMKAGAESELRGLALGLFLEDAQNGRQLQNLEIEGIISPWPRNRKLRKPLEWCPTR